MGRRLINHVKIIPGELCCKTDAALGKINEIIEKGEQNRGAKQGFCVN